MFFAKNNKAKLIVLLLVYMSAHSNFVGIIFLFVKVVLPAVTPFRFKKLRLLDLKRAEQLIKIAII